MRSRKHSIFTIKKQNLYLWGSMLGSLLLTILVIYVPVLSDLFEFQHISLMEFAISMAMAFSIIPIVEIEKVFLRHKK